MRVNIPTLSQKKRDKGGATLAIESGTYRGSDIPVRLRLVHMLWDLLEIFAGLVEVFGELMIESVAKLARDRRRERLHESRRGGCPHPPESELNEISPEAATKLSPVLQPWVSRENDRVP